MTREETADALDSTVDQVRYAEKKAVDKMRIVLADLMPEPRVRVRSEMRVHGYLEGSLLLQQEPKNWHALVMLDSGTRPSFFVGQSAKSHLFLHFDDIEEPHQGKQEPTESLVERGLTFARGKDRLLVCCRAGRGRSVAMAYLIKCQRYGVERAVEFLDPTRHRPNRLVIAIGDRLLQNSDVLNAFDQWRAANSHVKLSDYYDDLERKHEALLEAGAKNLILV